MGWALGIALTVVGLVTHDSLMIVAASIFALTGGICGIAVSLKKD